MKLECAVRYKYNSGLTFKEVAEKYNLNFYSLKDRATTMKNQGKIQRRSKKLLNQLEIDKILNNIKLAIDNELTIAETIEEFGLKYEEIRKYKKILCANDEQYAQKLLKLNNKLNGRAFRNYFAQHSVYDNKAYFQAKQIIKNKWTVNETCKNLNITPGALNTNLSITIKNNLPNLFKIVKKVQYRATNKNEKFYNIALETLLNIKKGIELSKKCFRQKYTMNHQEFTSFKRWTSNNYPHVYNRIDDMFKRNLDDQYIIIANYLIEHQCSYAMAGKHFGLSVFTVQSHINNSLRKKCPELYVKVKAINLHRSI